MNLSGNTPGTNSFTKFTQLKSLKKIYHSIRTLNSEKAFFFYTSLFLLALITFTLFISISVRNFTSINPTFGETFEIALTKKINNINPLFTESEEESLISSLVFSGLLKKDSSNNYVTDLAESITTEDNLTYKVTLKNDIYFSNGDEITSDDVIYTYKLIQSFDIDNKNRAEYEGLSFSQIDNKNFTFTLKKEYSALNDILTLGILNKKQFENEIQSQMYNSESNLSLITSGRYQIKEIITSNKVIDEVKLQASKYSDIPTYISNINIYTFDNYDELAKSNSGSKFDLIFGINDLADQKYFNVSDYSQIKYLMPRITGLFFNGNKNETFLNAGNRKFVYSALDRNYIVNNVLSNNSTPAYTFWPNINLDQTNNSATNTNTFKSDAIYKLTYNQDIEAHRMLAEYIKNIMAQNSVQIELVPVKSESMKDIIKNRDFEMLIYGIEMKNFASLYAFWHSSQKNAPGLNISNYYSDKLDKNLNTLRNSANQEDINNAFKEMENEFNEETPFIPLYSNNKISYIKNNNNIKISNFINDPKYLLSDIQNFYNNTERIYTPLLNLKNNIYKMYQFLHNNL